MRFRGTDQGVEEFDEGEVFDYCGQAIAGER
jgi:hypothetical protein